MAVPLEVGGTLRSLPVLVSWAASDAALLVSARAASSLQQASTRAGPSRLFSRLHSCISRWVLSRLSQGAGSSSCSDVSGFKEWVSWAASMTLACMLLCFFVCSMTLHDACIRHHSPSLAAVLSGSPMRTVLLLTSPILCDGPSPIQHMPRPVRNRFATSSH